jgi:predicted Zn-dependent protease
MRAVSSLPLVRIRHAARLLFAACLIFTLSVRPAMAQSILRDAETEQFFADISAEIIDAAKLDRRNVKIYLIGDRSINAFTAGGQDVYMHSGLIVAADNVGEIQGVIAHELGHVAGGHVLRSAEGIKEATGITLLSLLAGVAAVALGAGDAGMGIIAAGQQVALSKYLAFSRAQEASADAAAQSYLHTAGLSGKGMISFFKKLQGLEFRYGAKAGGEGFAYDHPLTGDRISILLDGFTGDPAWTKPSDPWLEARFKRVKAKLVGFVSEPKQTLQKYPESDHSVAAHYARAYAWHRSTYPERALAEVVALLEQAPNDPYFLELKGQILLESGRPALAIQPLRAAVAQTNAQPLIAGLLGHALIATEEPENLAEAERVLKSSVGKDRDNPFAWYQLGVVYEQRGDRPRAALATAERYSLEGRARLAIMSAKEAMRGIPTGSSDWIRAQDIALASQDDAEREVKRK